MFVDSGCAQNLEHLKFIFRARYGFHTSVRLLEGFEEVVKMFDAPQPRVMRLSRAQMFCAHEGDVLFSAKWDYDAEGRFFYKRFERLLDDREPETLREALERVNEYAEKRNAWIVFRELIKDATACEAYP
jgi:hypothetical protein